MKANRVTLLLGHSRFLNDLAQQLEAQGALYWQVQGADLPLYTFQAFPEQSRWLYAQTNAPESHSFLFYQLSQFFAEDQHLILFAETDAFFAAYLSRYCSADLYLRAELIEALDPLEAGWILATPTLKALFGDCKTQQNQNLNLAVKTLAEADIDSEFLLKLRTESTELI